MTTGSSPALGSRGWRYFVDHKSFCVRGYANIVESRDIRPISLRVFLVECKALEGPREGTAGYIGSRYHVVIVYEIPHRLA